MAQKDNPEVRIVPGKVHKIVVQNDGGKKALTYKEKSSVLGGGHDRVGFYFYTAAKTFNIKVYIKRLSSGLDIE